MTSSAAPLRLGLLGSAEARAPFERLAAADPLAEPAAAAEAPGELPAALDAAVVATPLERRAADACALLERGLHVLLPVPFAVEYAAFDALMARANAKNLRIGAWLPLRFDAAAIRMRQIVLDHALGLPHSAQLERLRSSGGDGYLGHALPLLNLACWIMGEAPIGLGVRPDRLARAEVPAREAHGFLAFGHAGEPLAFTTLPGPQPEIPTGWALRVACAGGALRLGADRRLLVSTRGEAWRPEACALNDPAAENFADWIEACRTGREPETNALDGLQSIALTAAAAQAARERRTVELVRFHYEQALDEAWERARRAGA